MTLPYRDWALFSLPIPICRDVKGIVVKGCDLAVLCKINKIIAATPCGFWQTWLDYLRVKLYNRQ